MKNLVSLLIICSLYFSCQKSSDKLASQNPPTQNDSSGELLQEPLRTSNWLRSKSVNWSNYLYSQNGSCSETSPIEFKSLETTKPVELYGNPQGLQVIARALIYLFSNGEYSLTYREYRITEGKESLDLEKVDQGFWTIDNNRIQLSNLAYGAEFQNEKNEKFILMKFTRNISDPRLIEIPQVEFAYTHVSEDPAGKSSKDICLGL